ncbi:MAG: SH3 domain-containing protein [Candidatus Omnitrophica bacterium]|nr:SH3 domain-containing protein [Candidatus Omnitrophota bacterium]MBU4457697.1 SH3 domain-containing protein [Candidatus Omnitrophota bacterium]
MKPAILCLVLILFFAMPVIGSADETEIPKIGFVKNDGSNVRAGDNVNFESLCKLDKLDPVKIIDKRYSWFKIALPKKAQVYISSDYVDVLSEEMRTGQVNALRVSLRAGPGTKYSILGQVSKPEEIDMISEKDGWYRIVPPDGTRGWIHENQLVFSMGDVH